MDFARKNISPRELGIGAGLFKCIWAMQSQVADRALQELVPHAQPAQVEMMLRASVLPAQETLK